MDLGPTLSTYCFYRFDYLFIVIVINALGVCRGRSRLQLCSLPLVGTEKKKVNKRRVGNY